VLIENTPSSLFDDLRSVAQAATPQAPMRLSRGLNENRTKRPSMSLR
jgi:hypothetical protein